MKHILPIIISENQSAFIHKRLITDNTMVSCEIFHHLRKASKRKRRMVGIKLDMEKAYDMLDWNFIKHTLINIGFPMSFTKIIMNCVTTVSLSILINGYPIEYFQPSRGIR